ncbi:MAG: hypothetical protein RBT49_01185 [Bacteroidales bacterium]|jgi:hypothetical protein|nr:hypothetical protein [Bacteroidales bacterium]
MRNDDVLAQSLKDFTLEKGEMSAIKGGLVLKVYSTTGVLLYDCDNQVYYNALGQVVTTTEAAV